MSDSLLKIQNGLKQFRSDVILKDIDLIVKPGEFVSLLGPSGSGKTTLLRLLAGLEQWTSGTTTNQVRSKSAFVFQEPNLLGWRTVLENTLLPLELAHQPSDPQRALKVLEMVHLEKVAHLYPHELSGGMKMRASIARALITKPDLLFMDEPFAALDEPNREKLQEQLRMIWATSSTTIIFVTHSIQEAVFLSNRIVFLSGKPATIGEECTLNLSPERTFATRSSDDYFTAIKNIRTRFHFMARKEAQA